MFTDSIYWNVLTFETEPTCLRQTPDFMFQPTLFSFLPSYLLNSPWASLTTLPLVPPRACNELICLCRLDLSIYRFMISICMLVYFVYGGGYVTCMLWLMPWDQRTTRGRLSSPSTRDWNQIIRLGSKYPYLLNHLTGPIYPRDLYFPPLLFKTGSGNYCWLLTCTWW